MFQNFFISSQAGQLRRHSDHFTDSHSERVEPRCLDASLSAHRCGGAHVRGDTVALLSIHGSDEEASGGSFSLCGILTLGARQERNAWHARAPQRLADPLHVKKKTLFTVIFIYLSLIFRKRKKSIICFVVF